MGYGLGILGGIGAFAGGLSKGWDEQEDLALKKKQEERDAARFTHEQDQWEREDEKNVALKAAGFELTDPKAQVLDPTAYKNLQSGGAWQDGFAAKDWRKKLTKLGAVDEAAFQNWAKSVNAPVTDDYDMRGYWKSGDYKQGTTVNANDGQPHYTDRWKTPLHKSFSSESVYANPKAGAPSWNDKDQLVGADGKVYFDERNPQRKADDYQPVLVNGSLVYAPRSAVKQMDSQNYVASVAKAMIPYDPVIASNMMVTAQTLESNNIKLAAQRWGYQVTQAQRIGGDKGLELLAKSYDDLPDGQSVKFARDKDGSIKLQFFADTQGGPIMTSEQVFKGRQGVTPDQEVFEYAGALASPEAMTSYLTTKAAAAQQVFSNMMDERRVKVSEGQLQLGREEFNHRKSVDWYNAKTSRMSATDRANGGFTPKQVMAAQTSMDKVVTSQLSAAGITPDMPNFDEAYGQYAESYLRRNPAVQQMLLGSGAVADMTGSPAPTTDTPPRGAMSRSALPWGGPKLTQRKLPSTQADPRARWRATPQSTDLYRKP